MSTCTKELTLEVIGCPEGGTAPAFDLFATYIFGGVPIFDDLYNATPYGSVVYIGDSYIWNYRGGMQGFSYQYQLSKIFPSNITGTAPITYSLVGTYPSGVTLDTVTGEINILVVDPSAIGNVYSFVLRATNACGTTDSLDIVLFVCAPIYWGEWLPPEPGSFSEAQIKTGLLDANVFPAVAGSRVTPTSGTDGWGSPYYPYGVSYFGGQGLIYPDTSLPAPISYIRVYAIPQGFLTGDSNSSALNPAPYNCTSFDNCASPGFVFKQTLSITVNGVPVNYDVYTMPATTALQIVSGCT